VNAGEHLREVKSHVDDIDPILSIRSNVDTPILAPWERICSAAIGFTNVKTDWIVTSHFEPVVKELHRSCSLSNGSGASSITEEDRKLMKAQLSVTPRTPLDHMGLLAAINRRAAARDGSVSPFCQVSFTNADARTLSLSHVFTETGEEVPFDVPVIFNGVDVSELSRPFEQARAFFRDGALLRG